jgi:hypothetical protein
LKIVGRHCKQRTRLAAVWGFEIRLPVTAAWLCFVVEVKNFCLALFVKLELKQNSEQNVDAYSVKPKLQQT